jgi:hypothetical protein
MAEDTDFVKKISIFAYWNITNPLNLFFIIWKITLN